MSYELPVASCEMDEAFAGIDVAFAKKKRLPIVVCRVREGVVEPLPLRCATAEPPRGKGNVGALDPAVRKKFAEETATYLRAIECEFGMSINRIAIDSPSDPKAGDLQRRLCECAMDEHHIRCFATPSAAEFDAIVKKAAAHLAAGGSQANLPAANQLWMLVGFALFERLRREWECLEVFPQAIAKTLQAAQIHKRSREGQTAQLQAAARFTSWPAPIDLRALDEIAFGSGHDRLDAYLAAWVASLPEQEREARGCPPDDVIWVPRLSIDAR